MDTDQRIVPGGGTGGVHVAQCVPRAGAQGAHRPGHPVTEPVNGVGEVVDPSVRGRRRRHRGSQPGRGKRLQQIQVVKTGRSGGQGDSHRGQNTAGAVGDRGRGESGEMFVEGVGDVERVCGVGEQQCAGACAQCPVGGYVDVGVGSPPREDDPVLSSILASVPCISAGQGHLFRLLAGPGHHHSLAPLCKTTFLSDISVRGNIRDNLWKRATYINRTIHP